MKPRSPHWADQTATRIVGQCGEQDCYVVASGITPSGTVHIGNFREVITVDLVARALRDLGKNVRFIYSWDNFDTFRKIPQNLPNQEMLRENLRRPISRIPDPYGKCESYARANEVPFEQDLERLGIKPEYLYQYKRYTDGLYAEQIKLALDKRDEIRSILNQHRKEPLGNDWLPTAIYCENCDRDEMEYERYDGDYVYSYKCARCQHEGSFDIREAKNIKLGWRVDWPMRWFYEKVDFEPGGKDHSSQGGSYDTGKQIVEKIWNRRPPIYLQYDFVLIKGLAAKMSSSKGNLITVSEALKVYTPQMIRWIFAAQRPNHDFSLAFDEDVIKTYDEFDRAEAQALGPRPDKLGKWPVIRRVYELSTIDGQIPEQAPFRPGFRVLCNRLQICDGDIDRTLNRFYADQVTTDDDRERFVARAKCAWNWLEHFAPKEFCYRLNSEAVKLDLSDKQQAGVAALRTLLEDIDLETIDPKNLNQMIYDRAIRGVGCEPKEFFEAVYLKLINREQGPRLPTFLKEIGRDRVLELL